MGSEFFINSQELEDKVRQLLPSQGGAGAGFDLSASTQIIPIIDLTESAEGSDVRQDLQTAISFDNLTSFSVSGANTNLITTTGYWRLFGTSTIISDSSQVRGCFLELNDGATDKTLFAHSVAAVGGDLNTTNLFDFIVKITAGDLLKCSVGTNCILRISTNQIASIDGTLT